MVVEKPRAQPCGLCDPRDGGALVSDFREDVHQTANDLCAALCSVGWARHVRKLDNQPINERRRCQGARFAAPQEASESEPRGSRVRASMLVACVAARQEPSSLGAGWTIAKKGSARRPRVAVEARAMP